jgi:hypothetical protein
MSYAEPPASKPAVTPVGQIIDESLQPAGQKARIEHINAQVHVSPEVRDVLVDSAQVVVAVASIIANSLESYTDPLGPIKITAEPANGGFAAASQRPRLWYGRGHGPQGNESLLLGQTGEPKTRHGACLRRPPDPPQPRQSRNQQRPDHGTTVTISLPCR